MYVIPIIYNFNALTFQPRTGYGCIYLYSFEDGKKYIGQTRRAMKIRHKEHAKSINKCHSIVDEIINEKIIPQIIYTAPIDELNKLEEYFISFYDSIYPKGWNFTTGGLQNTIVSNSTKIKQSTARKKYLHSVQGKEQRYRLGNNCKRSINQYSLTNTLLHTYSSIKEASTFTGIDSSSICRCLQKKQYTAGKYYWSYSNKIDYISDKKKYVKVYQYDMNGNFIKEWDSIIEASIFIGGYNRKGHISSCAKGKRKSAYGYIWCYEKL